MTDIRCLYVTLFWTTCISPQCTKLDNHWQSVTPWGVCLSAAILFQDAVLFGLSHETAFTETPLSTKQPFPFSMVERSAHIFLDHILRQLLRRKWVMWAYPQTYLSWSRSAGVHERALNTWICPDCVKPYSCNQYLPQHVNHEFACKYMCGPPKYGHIQQWTTCTCMCTCTCICWKSLSNRNEVWFKCFALPVAGLILKCWPLYKLVVYFQLGHCPTSNKSVACPRQDSMSPCRAHAEMLATACVNLWQQGHVWSYILCPVWDMQQICWK